jgi:hypothetical protein
MSLDKAIESGQERRKPYRGRGAIYNSCRCDCRDCEGNRQHKHKKQMLKSQEIE